MKALAVKDDTIIMTPDMAAELHSHKIETKETLMGGVTVHTLAYDIESIRVLRNLRVPIKTPLMTGRGEHYDFPGRFTPYKHQLATADFLAAHGRALCLNSPGTGKSASVIWAAHYLMKLGLVSRVLVFCPLSCVEEVWCKEIFGIVPQHQVHALIGPNSARKELLKTPSQWVITNHDAALHLADALADPSCGFDLIVADEATFLKNEQSGRTKGFKKIAKGKNYWLLTGTPTPQDPTDAYMLCKLVNPQAPQSAGRFKGEVMYRVNQFLWLPKKEATEVVSKYMTPAIRFDKKDCIDMPPITYENRKVALTAEQIKAIKDLRDEWVFEKNGERVMADRAATRLSKLLQVGQGTVIGDNSTLTLDLAPRLATMFDIIAESESKTIVFASFRAAIERIDVELQKVLGKGGNVTVHGDVSSSDRTKAFDAFKNDPKCKVLLAHPATTSHGLTLTSASTTIWFGPYNKFEAYQQANERMNRPGQRHDMRIINLYGMPEELLVYQAARKSDDAQTLLMELKKLLEV